MGIPVFEIPELIEKNDVRVFSSNYTLYGDMSHRVMSILSQLAPDIEIYSVDEAFVRLGHFKKGTVGEEATYLRAVLHQWLGIPVSVGLGPTKTLAKAANYWAKRMPRFEGVLDMSDAGQAEELLKKMPAGEVWGVGHQYEHKLKEQGIRTALDLKRAPEHYIRKVMHTPGVRTLKELNGISCIPLDLAPQEKKAICISRSYGRPLTEYRDVEAATALFTARVAEKLRSRRLKAGRFTVFLMTNRFARGPRYVNFQALDLPDPTNDTVEMNRLMVRMLKKIYRKGYSFKKSGVLVENLVSEDEPQLSFWETRDVQKQQRLMAVLDQINANMGREKLRFALQGFDRKWKMRQERLSRNFTTSWAQLLEIDI